MTSPKEEPEVVNGLPFIQKPYSLLSDDADQDQRSCAQNGFSNFNDSNSDDTQFDIQSGEVNSTQPSPVKENSILTETIHEETPKPASSGRQDRAQCEDKSVIERNAVNATTGTLSNTDATSFVDYFLAHDDLLQALDDYSRSVGQTSVFCWEETLAPQPESGNYAGGVGANKPSSALQTVEATHNESNEMNTGVSKTEIGSIGLIPEATDEKLQQKFKQRKDNGFFFSKHPRSATMPRRSEKRKPRTYSQAVPSQHCHICSRRPTETSPHAVCGNLLKGRCRKTICTKCFHQFRWDLKAAREAPPGTWECPHCRGECPQRAQCVIYNRTSDRRRMKLINHRKKKDPPKISSGQRQKARSKGSASNDSRADSPESGTTTMNALVIRTSRKSAKVGSRGASTKKAKISLQPSGITKSMRTSGIPCYSQLSFVDEDTRDLEDAQQIIGGEPKGDLNAKNIWNGLGLVTGEGVSSLQLASKVANVTPFPQLEMKGELELFDDKCIAKDERRAREDAIGVLESINLSGDMLNVTEDNSVTETGMAVGGELLNTTLDINDIEEPLTKSKAKLACEQVKLVLWDDEEPKFGQLGIEALSFPEKGLDSDAIADDITK